MVCTPLHAVRVAVQVPGAGPAALGRGAAARPALDQLLSCLFTVLHELNRWRDGYWPLMGAIHCQRRSLQTITLHSGAAQMRRTHARRAPTHGYGISLHPGIRLVMMPRSTSTTDLLPHACISVCSATPAAHLIRLFQPYLAIDKSAMAYTLTGFHHHRCRLMTSKRRKGSPKLIQYPYIQADHRDRGKHLRLPCHLLIETASHKHSPSYPSRSRR